MTMLISKFHRLIQSKVMWWSILSIIVLTFVVWGTTTPQAQKQNDEAASPGKLNGKSVARDQFQDAYYNAYLSVILSVGRAFNITPEIDEQLRQAAWMRIVSLDEAKKLGLSATDDEVASSIQQNQAFLTQDGQFYKAAYKNFVDQFLLNLGFTEKKFEEHVRQEIVLQKIRMALNRSTLVPPRDVRRTFSSISDKFKIEFVALGPDLVTNIVQVKTADAKAYFDKDPAAFTIPEKMKVKYVRFAVAPLIPKVEVTPDDAQEYYNEHLDDYLADTNTAAASTNMIIASKYKSFEDVKQEISNKLIHDKAMDLASERAMEFVMDLTPDRDGNVMSFEDAAKKLDTLVEKPEPFAPQDEIPDVDAGPAFNRAAFALTAEDISAVSEPVRGKEFVYVIGYEERLPSRVPTFDDVAGDVLPLTQAQALSDALSAKAQEIRDAAAKAVQEKKSFSAVVESFGATVVTSAQFTASTGPTTNKYSDLLMRGIMTMNQGEVSELLPAEDAILIAHVAERLPGDPTTFDSLKNQIETTIRRQNGRYVYDSWQLYLLKQAKLEEKKLKVLDEEPIDETVDHNT